MRQIILSICLALFTLSISPVQCMWYVVDPADTKDYIERHDKNYLLRLFMERAVRHAPELDGDYETQKTEEYCNTHLKKQRSDSLLTVLCPDPKCSSQLSSQKGGIKKLQEKLFVHWFSTKTHQETFYEEASALLTEWKGVARSNFEKRKPFTVTTFPGNNNLVEKQEGEIVQKRDIVAVPQPEPVRAALREATYFLIEASHETPGIFATYRANSREEVLYEYLRSKMLQGQLDGIESLRGELLARTKKQRMVQGDAVKSLVCPQEGCKHQVTEAAQNALDRLTLTLLVHYAAYHYHKHEIPEIKRLVALIAPSFVEARKNIEKGEAHE